jgi:uncharacterized membrane protein YdjX (TVP38/TMEM64 family)
MKSRSHDSAVSPWVRALVFALILAAGYVAIRYTPLAEWTDQQRIRQALVSIRDAWWSPLALLALYAIVAPTGISMFPLTIAGAAFGPVPGSLLNTVGILIGAITSFLVARALGRDAVVRLSGKRLRKAERYVNRQGIWPLIQLRFMPIPYPVVNFAAALSGVPPRAFVVASLIGLIPATLVHSYFIARLIYASGTERTQVALVYAGVLILINGAIAAAWLQSQRRRRNRYHALIASRSARTANDAASKTP